MLLSLMPLLTGLLADAVLCCVPVCLLMLLASVTVTVTMPLVDATFTTHIHNHSQTHSQFHSHWHAGFLDSTSFFRATPHLTCTYTISYFQPTYLHAQHTHTRTRTPALCTLLLVATAPVLTLSYPVEHPHTLRYAFTFSPCILLTILTCL